MSDIFREVEEDVRKERLEKLWKAYGEYVIALLVLVVLGVGGWQLWLRYQDSQRAKASDQFVAAQHITNATQAAAAYDALSKSAPGGYGELSRLAKANALASGGKNNDAVVIYRDIASSDSGPLGAVARLRAAWLLADNTPRADLVTLLAPINGDSSAWHEMAREVLAYSDYKTGKVKDAAGEFDTLANDPESPDALKNRARAFAAFLHEGGAANFGTVPPVAPAPAPGEPRAPRPPRRDGSDEKDPYCRVDAGALPRPGGLRYIGRRRRHSQQLVQQQQEIQPEGRAHLADGHG